MASSGSKLVLGIETSCDESAVALLRVARPYAESEILFEQISSQIKLHQLYGGVVPELAAREHLAALPVLYSELVEKTGVNLRDIDCIAVTRGPGLKGCLMIGTDFARGLSLPNSTALIGVNHIEGHLLVPLLDNPALNFPYLALVVSGGHTELVRVSGVGEYAVLARTTDDAAGEAFDKSAHLLGFQYPGGAELAALADSLPEQALPEGLAISLPQVMRNKVDFSFSGLKTAVSLMVKREQGRLSEPGVRYHLAKAIQEAIVQALASKVRQALHAESYAALVVTGGVSANNSLRKALANLCEKEFANTRLYYPRREHCTDNATMIAFAGGLRSITNEHYDLEPLARWPVESLKAT